MLLPLQYENITTEQLEAAYNFIVANINDNELEFRRTYSETLSDLIKYGGDDFKTEADCKQHAATVVLSHSLFYNVLGYEYDEPNAHNFEEAPGIFIFELSTPDEYNPIADKLIQLFDTE